MKIIDRYKQMTFWPKTLVNFVLILVVFLIITILSNM